jgi:hypothetical protein
MLEDKHKDEIASLKEDQERELELRRKGEEIIVNYLIPRKP